MACKCKVCKIILFSLFFFGTFLATAKIANALPVGPTATYVKNSTRAMLTNTPVNESAGGGYIYTYQFDAVEQNTRWKAYVGNVTGTLTLDDASGYSIYDWSLGTVSGEIYATRNSSTVSWADLNCTWAATNGTGSDFNNRSIEETEDIAMQHTRTDNITATFNTRSHPAFQVGETTITANSCYSILPYINNTAQSATSYFPEVILYDGTDPSDYSAGIVYAALLESDISGYDGNSGENNATYDFQMLLPEIGSDSWSSSTAYYFYVELT